MVSMTEPIRETTAFMPDLAPELLVHDLTVSLGFWVGLCGFEIAYDRPEDGFAYLTSGAAHVMLEQAGVGRNWITAPLDRPLGRGVNFQITVASIDPLIDRLAEHGWPLFLAPEVKWYRTGATEVGLTQFLVQDPDGYLLRFSARLPDGSRLPDASTL
jgi:catechol 2,3-dioxygenase-like lactoylglutathione lyase family enzyme